jgi:hypothetical protein
MKQTNTKLFLCLALSSILAVGCRTYVNTPSYGGNFPEKTSSKPKVQVQTQEAPQTLDNNNVDENKAETPSAPIVTETPAVQPNKKVRKSFLQAIPQRKYTDTPAAPQPDQLPIEKNANIGFWMVIGSLIGSFLPYVNILAGFAMIAGFVLGIIGLSNIKKNPGKYRGRGKAIAAIVIPIVILILGIILLALLFLAFATV